MPGETDPPTATAEADGAGRRSTPFLVAGGLLLASALLALLTRWDATLAAHPAQLVPLGVTAAAGAALIALGARRRDRRGGAWRTIGRVAIVLAAVGVAGAMLWLRPFTATDAAVRALEPGDGVVVNESATRIRLTPTAAGRGAVLVFLPGARVDPRAYVALLRPLAEDGYPVVIVKPPLGIGLLARGAAGDEVRRAAAAGQAVAVGGHSLGGTAAAMVVARERKARGLLLWASFPANDDLRDRASLVATSVSGSRDGLATPADIEQSRADLPPQTRFVVVPGALHADFGDYGAQRGDGERGIGHAEAQRAIVAASLRFMGEVAATRPAAP